MLQSMGSQRVRQRRQILHDIIYMGSLGKKVKLIETVEQYNCQGLRVEKIERGW